MARDPEALEKAAAEVQPYTVGHVLAQLERDVSFAFSKALNKRGISASLMSSVLHMWMIVLQDEELIEYTNTESSYPQYGLPIIKAVAIRYGFPNEIGDDDGDEYKYSCECGD